MNEGDVIDAEFRVLPQGEQAERALVPQVIRVHKEDGGGDSGDTKKEGELPEHIRKLLGEFRAMCGDLQVSLNSLYEDIREESLYKDPRVSYRDVASRMIRENILPKTRAIRNLTSRILQELRILKVELISDELNAQVNQVLESATAYCDRVLEFYIVMDEEEVGLNTSTTPRGTRPSPDSPPPSAEPPLPPSEPPPPEPPRSGDDEDDGDSEAKKLTLAEILEKIQTLVDGDPPELSSQEDQVARRFAVVEKLFDAASSHLTQAEKLEIQKQLLVAKANVYAKALFHRVAGLEADQKGWSFFDDSEGGLFGPAVFNKIEELRIIASTNGFVEQNASIVELLTDLRKSFSLIKGAYGYWISAGKTIIGNVATDGGGVSRQFPNLADADENMAMDGSGVNTLIKDRLVVAGEVVNQNIERIPRRLTEQQLRDFQLNTSFEKGGDFLPEEITLKGGEIVTLPNETTNGWLMRQFDKLMRHDFKAEGGAFIDPKSGRRIDSFEIAGQNVEDLTDYIHRKAQAYKLPISVAQVRRAFRFWSVLTINHAALAPHPTGISDKVYQTFHWSSYLAKEWAYGNLDGVVEPMLSLSLIGDPDTAHPLDLFTRTQINASIQQNLLHALAMKGVVDGGGFFANFNSSRGPKVEKVGKPGEEVDRVVGPKNGYSNNQKLVAALFNLPMINASEAPWDIEPPLEYFVFENGGERKKLTDFQDMNGNYIYEAMPWDQVSVMNYYRDLANKALGFVKNFFHSGWEDFASKVDGRDLTDLFKNIQYTLQFIPIIGHDVRFQTNEFEMDIRTQSPGGEKLHLTPNEVEDLLRLLVLVQYIIVKMKYREKTQWTTAKAQDWTREFFKKHQNYFAKSELLGKEPSERTETAKKILVEVARAMEPFMQKLIQVVQRGTTQAAEVAKRTT